MGGNVQDGDGVQVGLLLGLVCRAGVADDAHFGGQGAQGFFYVVQRHDGASGGGNVFAEFLFLGGFGLVAGKVHGVGPDGELADVIGQGEAAMGLHLGGEGNPDRKHQACKHGFQCV